MLKTKGDFVSEVRNHLKALNKDDYISARFILSTGMTFVQYLINNRPLWKVMRDLNAFTFVPCVELKRVKSHKCDIAEFRTCDKIMRTKTKIPEILNASGGFIIESITNMDNSEEYHPLRSPKDFKNSKKRQFGNSLKYYYFSNGYLYILNSTTELVNINALFLNENEAMALAECEDEHDDCKSALEDKFICPEEYKSTVRDQTVQLLLGGHRNIPEDENPDLDSNQKQRTN